MDPQRLEMIPPLALQQVPSPVSAESCRHKLESLLIAVTEAMKLTENTKVFKEMEAYGGLRQMALESEPQSPSKRSSEKKTYAGNQTVTSQGYEPRSPGGTNHFLNKAKERLPDTV